MFSDSSPVSSLIISLEPKIGHLENIRSHPYIKSIEKGEVRGGEDVAHSTAVWTEHRGRVHVDFTITKRKVYNKNKTA